MGIWFEAIPARFVDTAPIGKIEKDKKQSELKTRKESTSDQGNK